MKRTLLLKMLLSFLLFAILGFLSLSTFFTRQTYQYITEQEAEKLYLEARTISNQYATRYYLHTLSIADMQDKLSTLDNYLNASIWIIDSDGTLLIDSEKNNDSTTPKRIEDFSITSFGIEYYQTGTFYNTLPEQSLTVYAPIILNYKVSGYVLIHEPLTLITQYSDGFLNISYASLAIFFLCALLFLALFICMLYIPIHKLTKGAKAYATGNYEKKIKIKTTDEFGMLADSLNFMALELNTLEDDQRKFIANVSHDFRSPLTSIKGYIEAIKDGTIPYEFQDKYLNVILVETERLNKLTQGMLELNKYSSQGTILDVTDFDINNVIKMTVQSFEGTCVQKKITFELILTGQKLFVSADMSKIQQVMYNLIDNAIKFSHAGSAITIETTERNEKVFISVKDTGIGIPKDSLKKIWERFYKTDLSRGKDKKGTGLGLAIVKEIIQAHNENINVISTEDVGTEFIFTLPLTKEQ